MAIDVENLKIAIDVIDHFSDELRELAADLLETDALAEAVDDIRIDVDVIGEGQLAKLQAQLAALKAQTLGSGDVGGGVDRGRGIRTGGGRDLTNLQQFLRRFNLRMSDFHNLLARMIPMLVNFVGALPAAIAALGTLATAAIGAAAAFAVIGGLGLMSLATQRGGGDMMAGLTDIWEEIRDAFMDAFMPLAKAFDDVVVDALGGIARLFDEIAARGGVLVQLKDEARDFGQFILEFVPDALAKLGMLAQALEPVFSSLAQWIERTDFMGFFARITAEALPALEDIASAIVRMFPGLMNLSLGFLSVVDAILTVVAGFASFLDLIGVSGKQLGFLVGTLLTIWSVLFMVASVQSIWGGILATQAGTTLVIYTRSLAAAIVTKLGFTQATWLATAAVSALSAVITALLIGTGLIALTAVLGFVSSQFIDTSSNIDQATSSLQRFRRESNKLDGFGGGNVGGLPRGAQTAVSGSGAAAVDQSTTVYNVDGSMQSIENARRTQRKQSFLDKLFSGVPI